MNKHDGKMQGTQNPGVPSHLSGVACYRGFFSIHSTLFFGISLSDHSTKNINQEKKLDIKCY